MGRRRGSAVNKLFAWVRRQSMKVKIFFGITFIISSLVALRYLIKDTNQFFVASESVHAAGIVVLIYKLTTQKTCSGLSLQTQELTAMFLAVRLFCSFMMEHDIHTVLDFATLVSTLWVVPCAILALFIYPHTYHSHLSKVMWAFCVYLEAIAVLPQLLFMQKTKMIEPSTAHYVGYLWLPMVLLAESVQTFILADFCYYYVKSVVNGELLVSLPPV
ncbi:ER lumen protein retaining receptor [Cynara cardunculus var. scolymus]|uniref:ER lumen protein retaining receptor n=1 Tax=Cynara cardunculus var. scolymus TaxID=59895 RepID=A0A103XP38_CYNCS|nr:ER lumen protein retaining receptor [Cynara cardunculus var. scolymus]